MYPAQCYQCNARYRDPWQIHKAKYEHQDTKISTQPWSLGLNIACRLDIYAFVAPAQFRAPSTTHLISLTHGKHQQLHGRVTNNSRRRKAPDSQLKSVHALMNAMKYFLGCPIKISYHPRQCAEHYTIIHTNHALFSRHIYIYRLLSITNRRPKRDTSHSTFRQAQHVEQLSDNPKRTCGTK
jgi:hypothetical protein